MSQFILDFGSGNSCLNRWNIAKRMIDSLAEIDSERKCIIKWQLFLDCPPNIPLHDMIFKNSYEYAEELGFQTTASVFDKRSLGFLLSFDIPFVKIANRKDLDWLIGEVPRKIPVIKSIGKPTEETFDMLSFGVSSLSCVSRYPAGVEDYEGFFPKMQLAFGISDHTTDWTLYRKYQPEIYEVHFKLEDTTGPDSGTFARTPEMLREIL